MKNYSLPFLCGVLLFLAASPYFQWNVPLSAQTRPGAFGPADPLLQLSERFETIAARILSAVVAVDAVKPPQTGKRRQWH